MATIEANPYVGPGHQALIEEYLRDPRERAILVQATRNLLPDDDALLAAGAANAVRLVYSQLIRTPSLTPGTPEDIVTVAEGLVHLALAMRADGEPKIPQ